MSGIYDQLRGKRTPLRSSTPAPRPAASLAERLIPSFIRRASTPAPHSSRLDRYPTAASYNTLESRAPQVERQATPLSTSPTPSSSKNGIRFESARTTAHSQPSPYVSSLSASVPAHAPLRTSEENELLPEGVQWKATDVWNAARPALFQQGIYIAPSNLWGNWPAAQHWQKSDYVLRVKQRHSENGLEDVYVKALLRDSNENKVMRYLLAPAVRAYSALACPPVLRVLESPTLPQHSFFVMPPLTPLSFNEMNTIGDCLDFVRQALEGLVFLHSQGISHGDLQPQNIMIVPVSLGISPRQVHVRGSRKVHYCYIDFEFSVQFRAGETRLLRCGDGPGDASSPPEIMTFRQFNGQGYDPFPADVWMLGDFIVHDLLLTKINLRFLKDWARTLCVDEVADRPTAEAALRSFHDLIGSLTREECEKSTMHPRRPGMYEKYAHITGGVDPALSTFNR